MGRPRAEVVLTDSEETELIRLTKRARVNRAVAFRARMVLACVDASDTAVARRLRTTKTTVAKWRGQFVERRLEGLYDEPRVGAPRSITDETIEAVIVKTLEVTPPGETHWSTRSMAKAAGLSHSTEMRVEERFRRRDYGHMDLTVTITDPVVFTRPITFSVVEELLPDTDLLEHYCLENERDDAHFPGRERK
jgi:transposase